MTKEVEKAVYMATEALKAGLEQVEEAVYMAIEALERMDTHQCVKPTHEYVDLISRQAAIDALRYAQHRFTVADEAGGIGTVKWSEDVIYFAAAKNVLADLPSAQPEPQWIPCSERLPKIDEEVLVYLFGDSPYLAWYDGLEWQTEDFTIEDDEKPTAWMPLPEGWKGEE